MKKLLVFTLLLGFTACPNPAFAKVPKADQLKCVNYYAVAMQRLGFLYMESTKMADKIDQGIKNKKYHKEFKQFLRFSKNYGKYYWKNAKPHFDKRQRPPLSVLKQLRKMIDEITPLLIKQCSGKYTFPLSVKYRGLTV